MGDLFVEETTCKELPRPGTREPGAAVLLLRCPGPAAALSRGWGSGHRPLPVWSPAVSRSPPFARGVPVP